MFDKFLNSLLYAKWKKQKNKKTKKKHRLLQRIYFPTSKFR